MENTKAKSQEVKSPDPIHGNYRTEGIYIWIIVNLICLLPVGLPIIWESGERKNVFFSSLLAYMFALIIGLTFNFMKTLWKPRAELVFWNSVLYAFFLILVFGFFNYEPRFNAFVSSDIGQYSMLIFLVAVLIVPKLNNHNFDAWADEKYRTYLMNKANGVPLRREFAGMKRMLKKGN